MNVQMNEWMNGMRKKTPPKSKKKHECAHMGFGSEIFASLIQFKPHKIHCAVTRLQGKQNSKSQ